MLFFVYGTLRHEFGGEMARRLAAESEWVGEGMVENAQLYWVRGPEFDYPAMILMKENGGEEDGGVPPKVYGEIIRLKNPEKTLIWLDEYEECGPEYAQPNEYLRQKVEVVLKRKEEGKEEEGGAKKKRVEAITYLWNWPTVKDDGQCGGMVAAPIVGRILSGDWLAEEEKTTKR